MTRPTLLIPVEFPDPEMYPITDMSVAELHGFEIVLFGYWEVPETTTRESVREAHETEARAILYEMAAEFSHAGAPTDMQLHFGPAGTDRRALEDRIVAETDVDAVLLATQLRSVTNVLVPLRDDRHREQIVEFVCAFEADSIFVVELYHAAPDEDAVDSAERMLASVEDTLLARGFSDPDIERTVEVTDDPRAALATRARNHNVVVIGETAERDSGDRLFGPASEYIAEESETPTVVVQG